MQAGHNNMPPDAAHAKAHYSSAQNEGRVRGTKSTEKSSKDDQR